MARHTIQTFKCAGCGKVVSIDRPNYVPLKYCSHKCYTDHRNYQITSEKRKNGETKHCVVCGNPFYVSKCRIEQAIACSTDCQILWQRRNKEKCICENCGKTYYTSPSSSDRKFCSMECRNNSEWLHLHCLKMNVTQCKKSPNKFEQKGYSVLADYGIEYIPQYLVNNKFVVDAYVPDSNTVIQFDGDYWHGNPQKYKILDKRQKKRVAFDKSQDAYLRKIGWNVVRIWQSEIDNNEILERKLTPLNQSQSPP